MYTAGALPARARPPNQRHQRGEAWRTSGLDLSASAMSAASWQATCCATALPLTVRDLNEERVADFVARGARSAASPREMAEQVDLLITCLPSPAASAAVLEGADGVLAGIKPGTGVARDEHHRSERSHSSGRAGGRQGRPGDGLSGVGWLPSRGDRQYFDLCRRQPRGLREGAAGAARSWVGRFCTPDRSARPRP